MKTLSPFRFITLALGCTVLAMTTITPLAQSGKTAKHRSRTVPIRATFGNTGELTLTDTPGVFHNSGTGVGNVPRLGICTIVIDETVDFRTDPGTGRGNWVLTFAGGDKLTASLSGPGSFDQTDPAFIKGSLQGAITGGTGRFQGATGQLRGPFVAHVDTAPGVFPAEAHGTVELEGFVRLGSAGRDDSHEDDE